MHYYSFNIGDYHSHTSRLSQSEDLAYRRLLDLYYLNERPFTGCVEDIAREIGMNDRLTDVEYVLNKYFPFDGENWVNKRASSEIAKFHKQKKANSRAGKASAEARKRKASERPFNDRSTTVQPTNNQEPLTNNHKPVKDNGANATRFRPPTVDEVRTYCQEKGHNIDPERFVNFYDSKGWMVGKNKMQKWKAAVANWSKKHAQDGPRQPENPRRLAPHERVRAAAERRAAEQHGAPISAMGGNGRDVE